MSLKKMKTAFEAFLPEVLAIDAETVIKDETSSAQVLSQIFLLRHDLTEDQYRSIVCHINCPQEIVAATMLSKPDWLVDAESITRIRLECVAGEKRKGWDDVQKQWQSLGAEKLLKKSLYILALEDVKIEFYSEMECILWLAFSDEESAYIYNLLLSHCPIYLLEYFIDRGGKDNLQFILEHQDNRTQTILANHSSYKIRQMLAASALCSDDTMLTLSQDKYLSVRKALALNPICSRAAAVKMIKEGDEKIQDALSKNTSLSDLLKKSVSEKRKTNKPSESTGTGLDVRQTLKLLSDPMLDEATVFDCARSEHNVVCAAASHHVNASERVHATVLQSSISWVSAAAAQYTQNEDALRKFASSSDFGIQLALASNPNLPTDARQVLLKTSKSLVVAQQLAAVFHDDEKLLQSIATASKWGKRLDLACDVETAKGALTSLHKSDEYRHLAISIALAKHATTSDAVLPFLYTYLADELKPVKVPKKPGEYGDWKLTSQFDEGSAHACLINYYLDPCRTQLVADKKQLKLIRLSMSCRFLDISKVPLVVLWDDAHIGQRLMRKDNPNVFTHYVYEALSYHRLASVRKALAANRHTPGEIIQRLCEDSDAAVRDNASQAARKRKLTVKATAPSAVKPKAPNKQERLHLALSSQDTNVLAELAVDKTRDVRVRVTRNKLLDKKYLTDMLADSDDKVVHAALEALRENHRLTRNEKLQTLLERTLCHQDKKIAKLSLELLGESPLDDYYPSVHDFVNHHIIRLTNDVKLIERIEFDIQRSQTWGQTAALLQNPLMSVHAFEQLKSSINVKHVLRLIANRDVAFKLIENIGSFDSKYEFDKFDAIFSTDQVRAILKSDEKWIYCIQRSLHALSDEELIALFNKDRKTAEIIADSPNLSANCVAVFQQSEDKNVHSSLVISTQFTQESITKYLEDPSYKYLWAYIAMYQIDLSDIQLIALSERKKCQENILYRNPPVSNSVLEHLYKHCTGDLKNTAAELLGKPMGNLHDSEAVVKCKNIQSSNAEEKDEKLNLTDSLALHKAPFGAAKAYRLLDELGLIVTKNNKYDEKIRKITQEGRQYAESHDGVYGDSTPVFFQSQFEELLLRMIELHAKPKAA